jgi:hypothetical protein
MIHAVTVTITNTGLRHQTPFAESIVCFRRIIISFVSCWEKRKEEKSHVIRWHCVVSILDTIRTPIPIKEVIVIFSVTILGGWT